MGTTTSTTTTTTSGQPPRPLHAGGAAAPRHQGQRQPGWCPPQRMPCGPCFSDSVAPSSQHHPHRADVHQFFFFFLFLFPFLLSASFVEKIMDCFCMPSCFSLGIILYFYLCFCCCYSSHK